MHNFKKGDRVRLVHLDGGLSEHAYPIYDLWGDETHARNMSYIVPDTGGAEQFYHTDLLKREGDTSPVVVPNGGEWYIARGNNMGWGRAMTMNAAIENMRRQGGRPTSYVVHKVSKWTMVDGMGSMNWLTGIEPVEVKRVEPKAKAK